MKNYKITYWIISGVALGLLSALASGYMTRRGAEKAAGPRFEPEALRFGKARQSETLFGTLKFTNRSATPVRIIGVESSCSCTVASGTFMNQRLQPGEAADVPVQMKTGLRDGEMSSNITLFYENVGVEPRARDVKTAVVSVEVLPDFRTSPEVVDFGAVDDLVPLTRLVHVTPMHAETGRAELKGVHTSNRAFRARVIDQEGDGPDGLVEVMFDGSGLSQSEPLSGIITVTTGSPRAPEIKVLARATFRPPVELTPSALILPDRGDIPDQNVQISTNHESLLVGPVGAPGYVEIVTKRPSKERTHEIVIRFKKDSPATFDDELRFQVRVFTPDGGSLLRSAALPVHRLRLASSNGE